MIGDHSYNYPNPRVRLKEVAVEEIEIINIDPYITFPIDQSTTNNLNIAFGGIATPGSSVEAFVDGVSIGTFVADDNGRWGSTIPNGIFVDGNAYTITAIATLEDDVSAVSNSVTVLVDLASTQYLLTEIGDIFTAEDGDRLIWT